MAAAQSAGSYLEDIELLEAVDLDFSRELHLSESCPSWDSMIFLGEIL